uniref:Zinc phosphodiesterase ELAC protein 2 n=1 Tax=Neolamprologus brichardi TaxID=32507 RepID=A0A3Q4ML57_NEOBR
MWAFFLLMLRKEGCAKAKQKEPLRRVKTKENRSKRGDVHGPSTVYLQVVGAGSRDNAASVYVFSEFNRYLFNCGEGTQRLMQEHKLKAARLDNIFLTRLSWENVGGLSAKSRDNDRNRSHRSGRNSPTQATPQKADVSSADDPGESEQARLDMQRTAARDSSLVVAFACKLHPKKGNFLVAQAKELGLPVGTAAIGPIIAALKAGKSIVHEGKEIRPEQVCTPTDPGPVFIMVECPSEEFLGALCTNQQLGRKRSALDQPLSTAFFSRLFLTSSYKCQGFIIFFPTLFLSSTVEAHQGQMWGEEKKTLLFSPAVFLQAVVCVFFTLVSFVRDAIPSCNSEEFVKEASEVPNFLAEVDECRKICSAGSAELSGKYPEVVFLGTGSALPMKIRNVSGTLVNISPSQSLLLDCGEGTFGQLCRHYGDDVDDALSKIATVFISHLHADHHTGLVKLLYQRERALATLGKPFSPIFLVAPVQIMTWLNQYHDYCEEILSHIKYVDTKTSELIRTHSTSFHTCLVRHCKNAFACSFTHQAGWKLAFSGDTMPCDAFVHIGKNATLLIHEATLEDELEEEAVEKRHSTTSQAIGIGMKMNADFIVLNHFSQRYAKIPLFSEDFNDRVGISFDHMRIRFDDSKIIPKLIPALKTLFAEELGEMEERRERREMRYPRGSSSEVTSEHKTGAPDVGRGAKRDQEETAAHVETKRLKSS